MQVVLIRKRKMRVVRIRIRSKMQTDEICIKPTPDGISISPTQSVPIILLKPSQSAFYLHKSRASKSGASNYSYSSRCQVRLHLVHGVYISCEQGAGRADPLLQVVRFRLAPDWARYKLDSWEQAFEVLFIATAWSFIDQAADAWSFLAIETELLHSEMQNKSTALLVAKM